MRTAVWILLAVELVVIVRAMLALLLLVHTML